jgi:hypothetical protein
MSRGGAPVVAQVPSASAPAANAASAWVRIDD